MLAFSDKNMRIELVRLGSLFPRSVSEDSAVAVGPYRFRPGVRQYIVIDECGEGDLFISWWPGSRKKQEGVRGLMSPSKVCPQSQLLPRF